MMLEIWIKIIDFCGGTNLMLRRVYQMDTWIFVDIVMDLKVKTVIL